MSSALLRLCLVSLALAAAACGPEAPEPDAPRLAGANEALYGAADGGSPPAGKVAVCHVPPGNPANAHTLVVGEPALSAHLRHGDLLGACGGADGGSDGGTCRHQGEPCGEAAGCCVGLSCGGEGRCVIPIN